MGGRVVVYVKWCIVCLARTECLKQKMCISLSQIYLFFKEDFLGIITALLSCGFDVAT